MSSADLGIESPDETSLPARAQSGTRTRAVLAGALVVVLVLGLVVGGYLVYRLEHPDQDPFNPFSGAAPVASDTDGRQASAVAEQFALRMDAVNGSDFAAYVKGVNQLLTTKAKAKNSQVFNVMEKSYAAAKVKGTGKVLLSGVADADADSATVLVAHDASVTTTQGNIQHHYRWSISLAKVGGRWLVDDFNPVN